MQHFPLHRGVKSERRIKKMNKQPLCTNDCTEKVIRYYSDMVYRLAFARTGTKQDADDVFQEVFFDM